MPRTVRWHKPDVQLTSPFTLWIKREDLVHFSELLRNFIQQVEEQLGVSVEISCDSQPPRGFHLELQASATRFRHEQGYRLEISDQLIQIEAKSHLGAALGIQTLLQILLFSGRTVPTCYITDYPDHDLRGVYLNLTNGGIPRQETFEEIVCFLSALKLNRLDLFLADVASRDVFHDWQKFELQQYGKNRSVEVVWHPHELLQKKHEDIFYLPLSFRKPYTGVGPIGKEQFQEWLDFVKKQPGKGLSFGLQPDSGIVPTLLFLFYPLVTYAAKSWCYESNLEEDGHPWLDEIYFHERSGSAAALCRDLALAIENPEDQELRALWIENILREQAQLDYLEFQRAGGKWFLNELQITCDLLLSHLLGERDVMTVSRKYQQYCYQRYLPRIDLLPR